MISAQDLLLAAALFARLGVALLLATADRISALEAPRGEDAATRGGVSGRASFTAEWTATAVWAWYEPAFVVRPCR